MNNEYHDTSSISQSASLASLVKTLSYPTLSQNQHRFFVYPPPPKRKNVVSMFVGKKKQNWFEPTAWYGMDRRRELSRDVWSDP